MLNLLADYFSRNELFSAMRLFDFITVRAALALLFSFVFCLVFGGKIIARLQRLQAVQYIHDAQGDGAISLQKLHGEKKGTPTMGGLMMFGALICSVVLFTDLTEPVLWLGVLAMVGYCGVGFLDDYLKVVKKNSAGLSSRGKLIFQGFIGLVFGALFLYIFPGVVNYEPGQGMDAIAGPGYILFPFIKTAVLGLGIVYLAWVVFIFWCTTNAVNLTDGQDGLAAGVTIFVAACLTVIAYLAGRVDMSSYLIIPHIQGAGELAVLLAGLTGACLGFLWFNSHPADVFMGDTGSMMIGGMLGAVALLTKQEFLLLIVGGIFVVEALSVILQVGSYKLRGKRIFRMAPIHHHFQMAGIPEAKITMRFWIVSALLALVGLVTLKLR
ncbi:MAG: phospho-N-acetylmuramoyl-pentapeptide-transferase [Candidatus Sumerlaeia bacterium]|nr:phospho-N-acetylmuramoyl-pentapeptide-transferase [Candidatus Sumerlaeia bacterium]